MDILKKTSFTNRIIWIILVFGFWYILVGSVLTARFDKLVIDANTQSDALVFVLEMYTGTIMTIIAFALLCLFRKNRDIGKMMLPNRKTHSWSLLVAGLLLFILCRNTAVCSYSCLLDLSCRLLCSDGTSGRNHCDVLC